MCRKIELGFFLSTIYVSGGKGLGAENMPQVTTYERQLVANLTGSF
jgi:hypothetical protein